VNDPSPRPCDGHAHRRLAHTSRAGRPTAEHVHVAEAPEQLADANRVKLHRGPRLCWRREPSESQGPCAAPGTLTRDQSPLRSEEPVIARDPRRHAPIPPGMRNASHAAGEVDPGHILAAVRTRK